MLFPQSTPLHSAAMNGNLKIVEYLVKRGAEVSSQDQTKVRGYYTTVGLQFGHFTDVAVPCRN